MARENPGLPPTPYHASEIEAELVLVQRDLEAAERNIEALAELKRTKSKLLDNVNFQQEMDRLTQQVTDLRTRKEQFNFRLKELNNKEKT